MAGGGGAAGTVAVGDLAGCVAGPVAEAVADAVGVAATSAGALGADAPADAARACALPSMSSSGIVVTTATARRPAASLIHPPAARTLARAL